MSQPPQRIRFAGPPVPRAKPVPRQQWEVHKDEIGSLYQKMRLEELMSVMASRHRFRPTTRQYIYQFEKWGLRKYSVTSKDSVSDQGPLEATSSPYRAPYGRNMNPGTGTSKRPKSVGSLQSVRTQRSSTDKPRVPPKKRQKLKEYMAARDPRACPGTASDNLPPIVPSSPRPPVAEISSSTPYTTLSTSAGSTALDEYETPDLIHDDGDWMTVDDPSDTEGLLIRSQAWDEATLNLGNPSYGVSSKSGPRRLMDSSRPTHTFSQDEVDDMKLAAIFLQSLGFDGDAFELFALDLKRLKGLITSSQWMKSAALIKCARSAYWSSQVSIARSLLEKTLDEPREACSEVEHFLFRMLLADTYTRLDDELMAQSFGEIAIGCELANEKILDRLPAEHRCYDIITYHYLNKCLEYMDTFVHDHEGTIFSDRVGLQLRLLERKPGPFELTYGTLQNPCLRSCLQWCTTELANVFTLPAAWQGLSSNEQYIYWADHIGLYCCLWDRWQAQTKRPGDFVVPSWMTDSDDRMGITSAELLSITCGLIMSVAPPRRHLSKKDVIVRARRGACEACRYNDVELGHHFLDTFAFMVTLFGTAPKRQFHDVVSFIAFLFSAAPDRDPFGSQARDFARAFIEDSLNIALPQVHADVDEVDERSQRSSSRLDNVARRSMDSLATIILPTLASSIHSSDTSAMRSMRDRIDTTTRKSFDITVALPSSMIRTASRSYSTLPSISQLSQAMRSSLSLSSMQQAGNAALDTLVSVSNNVREQFVGPNCPFGDDDLFDDRLSLFAEHNPFSERYEFDEKISNSPDEQDQA